MPDEQPRKLVVAVSGGVDSMFLLDFLTRCNVRLHVAHVNHNLRPEALQEQQFVQTTTKALGLPFSTITCQGIADAPSIEAEARRQRYEFLRSVKQDVNAFAIVTGHHLNDQVETILLRLMRGAPHDRLGMVENNGDVFRPFLEVSKEEILREATQRNLAWMEDSSNSDEDFERNWVRHTLLPEMMKRRNVMKTIPSGLLK